ncbi:hypothetical protein [Pseudomonas aeruginosa]|nr:hypothetical protein [Pseudomonas aeruginosa]
MIVVAIIGILAAIAIP